MNEDKWQNVISELEVVKRRLARLERFEEEAETIEDAIVLLKEQQETIWALEIDLDDTLDVMCEYAEELKSREPRTMTLEEAQGEDEVWFEFRPSNVGRYADCYMHDTGDRTRVYFTGKSVMSLFENADYGRQWRCWTSRPTDEQRKAVKWDEDQC